MKSLSLVIALSLMIPLALVSADPPRKGDRHKSVAPPHRDGEIKLKRRLNNLLEDVESIGEIAHRLERSKTRRKLLRRLEELRHEIRELKQAVPRRVIRDGYVPPVAPPVEPPVVAGPVAMDEAALSDFLASVKKASFSRDKLELVSIIAKTNWFTVDQAGRIMAEFSFDKDKLKAVAHISRHILDRENHYKLYEQFTFSSSKKKLKAILNRK